jgi:hypothetical protein
MSPPFVGVVYMFKNGMLASMTILLVVPRRNTCVIAYFASAGLPKMTDS